MTVLKHLSSARGLRHHYPRRALRLAAVRNKGGKHVTSEEIKALVEAAPPEDAIQHHDRVDEADPVFQDAVHHLAERCSACGQVVPDGAS